MALKFGTDGVRGVANAELTPELVLALGRASARVLGGYTFLVGRDTRASGSLIQAALSSGLAAEGVDVVDLGVIPTPGVAALSTERNLAAAVISASHNPFADNGIKLFAAGGRKLSDDIERRLEDELAAITSGGPASEPPVGAAVGRLRQERDAIEWYRRRLESSLDGRSLDGMTIVLDCAHGASVTTAPGVFRAVGASVVTTGDSPDGTNINAGVGATAPEALAAKVLESAADLGLAFDGDADRVIAVDAEGKTVDGDHIMAICATDLHERGLLHGDTVAVTVMTNLGFRLAMAERGIEVHETPVGDRYVLEALEAGGWSLGGEQSGHIIFRDLATTGDGVLTGLQLADVVARSGRPLGELSAAAMTRLPQVLKNVRVATRTALADLSAVESEVRAVEAELGDHGRVLLRPSGTEPLIRVMVEAPTHEQAEAAVDRLVAVVSAAAG